MKFTVAICTWNRAAYLRQTLESFCRVRNEGTEWEILVVNNNCTDDTDSVCESYVGRLPVRMIRESEQGHSVSRNRAIDESAGQYVIWTDDDVLVDPGLLAAYESATTEFPDGAFFGGKILPRFEAEPARWIRENREMCAGVFAERDLGDTRMVCTKEQLPFGANLVIRRDCQERFRFRPDFGRQADVVRGFDEIDVLRRLLDDGQRGYWIPEARVEHLIPASRMTLEYFARYFHGQGQTWTTRGIGTADARQLRGRLRRQWWKYWISRLGGPSRWFPEFALLNNLRGQLDRLHGSG